MRQNGEGNVVREEDLVDERLLRPERREGARVVGLGLGAQQARRAGNE